MPEKTEKLPRSPDRDIIRGFKAYFEELELSKNDVAVGRSIGVVGAGDNTFAAGLHMVMAGKPHAFVMGMDPAEEKYEQLDPAIINHDARALGFPSDFEGFDLVVSFHAVPKYFIWWGHGDDIRNALIDQGKQWYDYEIANKSATREEISNAIYTAFSEMLRITKPGGRVKVSPVMKSLVPGMKLPPEEVMEEVLIKLGQDYPGLQARYFNDNPKGFRAQLKSAFGITPDKYIHCGLEIVRPLSTSPQP